MNVTQPAKCQIKQNRNVPLVSRMCSFSPYLSDCVAAHLHTLENYFLLLSTFPLHCLSPLIDMHLSKQFSVSFPDRGWWKHIEEHLSSFWSGSGHIMGTSLCWYESFPKYILKGILEGSLRQIMQICVLQQVAYNYLEKSNPSYGNILLIWLLT